MCGQLDNRVQACYDSNDVELQGFMTWVAHYLEALAPAEAEDGEPPDAFADRMLADFLHAVSVGYWWLTPAGDRCDLPDVVPATCTGDNLVSYDELGNVIGELTTTANFHRYLEQRIAAAGGASVWAHQTLLQTLCDQLEEEEASKATNVQMLYHDFDIDDLSLADFAAELEQEYNMAKDAGLLPSTSDVDPPLPPVPTGSEDAVADLRDHIEAKAEQLEDLMDFNNFAFGHVCGRATDEIQEAIDDA